MPSPPESALASRLPPERRGPAAAPPGPAGRARYWGRLVPALALLAAVVHLPAFCRAVWNPDEGFLAVEARLLSHGGTLYATVVDRKPPLLPWLYQGGFALFGDGSLWPLRAAAVAAHLLTAVLLASVARRRWGDRYGVVAGAGYVLLSIGLAPEDTQAAGFEVFMLPWTAAAFWCAQRSRWCAAGLAVAGAALTKQTGAAVLLPVLWMLWRAHRPARHGDGSGRADSGRAAAPRPGPVSRALRAGTASRRPLPPAWSPLAAGALVPLVLAALGLGARRFLFWTVTGSGSYLSPAGAWLTAAGRALGNTAILAVACAGALAPAVWPAVRRRRCVVDSATLVWLLGSAVAVTAGFQFYGHYYLQLLPPLTLVGTAALHELPRYWKPAALWTVLASGAFLAWGLTAPRTELDHSVRVAAAVREHTGPRGTVLIWGMHPEQYWLAGRLPASRFLTAGFLTNFSGGHGGARVGERYAVPGAWRAFRRELAARLPVLVVDDSRGAPYAPARIPELRGLLERRYVRVGTVGGAVLYELRERAGEQPGGPSGARRPVPRVR